MSEAVPPSSCVLPDNFTDTDDMVAQPGDIMLVNSPPDDAKEISNHLMSPLEQQDTNSDSGDSLFITQKCAPQRRRRSNRRSNFRAHRESPEDEYDASTSEEDHPEDSKWKKKSCTTPKFTFHFLKERMMTRLPYYQNRKLHYYAMGGYFRCTEQLWDSYQTGDGLLLSLPTADQDGGEPMSPMSEEEDETTENEDIRVVEKKLFVVSKTKNSQPWYNPRKRSSEETQHNEEHDNAAREPQGGPGIMTRKMSTRIPLLRGPSSSKTKESDEISEETESVDKRVSTSGNLPAETGMGKKSRSPGNESRASGLIPEENEQMLGNESDATCRGLSAEQSDREATDSHTGAEEQTGVRDNDIECRTIKVKKRKKEKKDREDDKCVEEGKDQSVGGAEGHQTDPSANLIITEAVEAPCMEKEKRQEEETWIPSSRGASSSKTKKSDEISEETKSVDKRVSTSGNLPAETGMGKKSRSPGNESRASGLIPEENEQMLGNESDATCRDLSAEQSDREATDSHTGAEEQTGVRDNDIECRTIKVKKRKKEKKDREDDKCEEEGKYQSVEGAGGHQTDSSANLIITEAVEAPCMEKKKKKKKLENQYIKQEADEQSDQQKEKDFVVVCETENVDTDSLKTNKVAESATNDVHVPKKRKKKKKDSSDLNQTTTEQPKAIDHSSNGEVFQEMLEFNGFKRKKHKKKKRQPPNDNQTDVDLSNDPSTMPENTDFVYKKKKKKHVSDQVGLAEEDESVEKTSKDRQDIEPETKKKKKKKKMKDDINVSNSEDMLGSGDYSGLVREKKKKRKRTPSVHSADEEQSPSAHECCAEKPEVSAGELAAESADVSEHLQESKDGKKKKRRSATVSESEERELEETSEVLVKNKEKRKRTERLTGSLESAEQSQTEEAVVVKKTKKKRSRQEVPHEEQGTNPGTGSRFNATSSKTFPAELETSSSRCVERKSKRNAKRRLYNPDKDFFSDLNRRPDKS